MKRLLSLSMIVAMVTCAIVSCKDDFNEEDFLRLQSDLKLKQDEVLRQRFDSASEEAVKEYIAALNEAGDLLAVSLVVRENGNALQGVTVTLSSGTPQEASAGGRVNAVTTGTTDASGTVVFDRVTIGSGTATFSKSGYVTATATYDFGPPPAPTAIQVANPNGGTITKYVPPVKAFRSAAVPMISATPSEGSTATITGKVTIENDLTNLTPEVPTGLVLRANLSNLIAGSQGFFTAYTLADNSTLGRATIAADGSYTMTVPATAAGTTITLIIPNIEGTAKMAVNGYDNGTGTIVTLANGPEYRNVPTSWGPQAVVGFGNIVPQVAGAKLVFPTAPAAGSGLTFDLTPVSRPLVTNPNAAITSAEVSKVGETFFKISSRGNYGSGPAPIVTITGGGGQGAYADVFMRTYVSALTVSNVGSGYTANSNITLQIERVRSDDSVVPQGDAITVKATATGTLPATINLASFAAFAGFHPDMQASMTNPDLKLLRIKVTGDGVNGAVTGTFKTELLKLDFSPLLIPGSGLGNPGSGFTSAPTFTFTGGGLADGSPDHAAVQVVEFPVNWTINPNNSAATDYPLVPSPITINYPAAADGTVAPSESNVEAWSSSGDQELGSISLASRLTVSSGDIVKREAARILRTITKSAGKPSISFTTKTPQNAQRILQPVNINQQGNIISFPGGGSNGSGYNSPVTVSVVPAIAGAPGSGAAFTLSNSLDATTLEYTWNGGVVTNNQGSGYLQNLNQKGAEGLSFTGTVNVQAGKTNTVDIIYGTGNRKVNVN